MKTFISAILTGLLLIPSLALAAPTIEELQQQIAEISEQLAELEDRIEPVERHKALDRITWYGDLRTKVDTLHYKNVTWNPAIRLDFADFGSKFNGVNGTWDQWVFANDPGITDIDPATGQPDLTTGPVTHFGQAYLDLAAKLAGLSPEQQAAAGRGHFMLVPAKKTSDVNNDLLYTTRLRLGMKAEVAKNMNVSGRLLMYKNWGDSTGTQVFDSWNAFTMDGTNGGNTTGDYLRVERLYFNWKDIGGSPFYLSIGRRPSTYGSPTNYRENEQRGGTPTGHLVNFNFDGITVGYHLEDLTGIEGMTVRFCYGQGFESEWGNGELYNDLDNLEDTHLGGFNIDAFNNGDTLVQLTMFRAMDVTDGFKGTFAFPDQLVAIFAPTIHNDTQAFPNMNFVTRYTPSTVIGDINLLGINASHETWTGYSFFGSVGMTQLESNGKAGLFGGLGNDAVFQAVRSADGNEIFFKPVSATDSDTNEGYGVYVGIQTPAPMGKFGLEYNYGSKYWSPFTQAQDDVLGSKLATRGHAAEAYYIFEINPKAFIKLGGIYYDYEYTGSGSPVGEPKKVSDVKAGTAYSLLPAVDTAWDAYAQVSMRW